MSNLLSHTLNLHVIEEGLAFLDFCLAMYFIVRIAPIRLLTQWGLDFCQFVLRGASNCFLCAWWVMLIRALL